MPYKRRKFSRRKGERRYRNFFILAVEGNKTEPHYFNLLNDENSTIKVKCLKKGIHDNAPLKVLARMKKYLKAEELNKSDEAWLVVDKDQWTNEHLCQLYEWSQQSDNYGFALSNPKFEFWLLLHFEDGAGISNSKDCSNKLKKYLPSYDKGIDVKKISDEMIEQAIKRARLRDNPPCSDWPRSIGTTVYKLVERILESRKNQ